MPICVAEMMSMVPEFKEQPPGFESSTEHIEDFSVGASSPLTKKLAMQPGLYEVLFYVSAAKQGSPCTVSLELTVDDEACEDDVISLDEANHLRYQVETMERWTNFTWAVPSGTVIGRPRTAFIHLESDTALTCRLRMLLRPAGANHTTEWWLHPAFNSPDEEEDVVACLGRSSLFKAEAYHRGLIRPFLLLLSLGFKKRSQWAAIFGVDFSDSPDPHRLALDTLCCAIHGLHDRIWLRLEGCAEGEWFQLGSWYELVHSAMAAAWVPAAPTASPGPALQPATRAAVRAAGAGGPTAKVMSRSRPPSPEHRQMEALEQLFLRCAAEVHYARRSPAGPEAPAQAGEAEQVLEWPTEMLHGSPMFLLADVQPLCTPVPEISEAVALMSALVLQRLTLDSRGIRLEHFYPGLPTPTRTPAPPPAQALGLNGPEVVELSASSAESVLALMGKWDVDPASDSMEPWLGELGWSYLARKAAAAAKPQLEIDLQQDRVTIRVTSKFKSGVIQGTLVKSEADACWEAVNHDLFGPAEQMFFVQGGALWHFLKSPAKGRQSRDKYFLVEGRLHIDKEMQDLANTRLVECHRRYNRVGGPLPSPACPPRGPVPQGGLKAEEVVQAAAAAQPSPQKEPSPMPTTEAVPASPASPTKDPTLWGLAGRWEVDAASDSMEPWLREVGWGYVARKAAAAARPTLDVELSDTSVAIRVTSAFKSGVLQGRLAPAEAGLQWELVAHDIFGPAEQTFHRHAGAVVHRLKSTAKGLSSVDTYRLEGPQLTIHKVMYDRAGAERLRCRRVYNRLGASPAGLPGADEEVEAVLQRPPSSTGKDPLEDCGATSEEGLSGTPLSDSASVSAALWDENQSMSSQSSVCRPSPLVALAGSWLVDDASDSMEEWLREVGWGFVARKAAAAAKPKLKVALTDNTVAIRVTSAFKSGVMQGWLAPAEADVQWEPVTHDLLGPAEQAFFRRGDALCHVLKSPSKARLSTDLYHLHNGQLHIEKVLSHLNGAEILRCHRQYNRA
eukprot:EG_transcript_1702